MGYSVTLCFCADRRRERPQRAALSGLLKFTQPQTRVRVSLVILRCRSAFTPGFPGNSFDQETRVCVSLAFDDVASPLRPFAFRLAPSGLLFTGCRCGSRAHRALSGNCLAKDANPRIFGNQCHRGITRPFAFRLAASGAALHSLTGTAAALIVRTREIVYPRTRIRVSLALLPDQPVICLPALPALTGAALHSNTPTLASIGFDRRYVESANTVPKQIDAPAQ